VFLASSAAFFLVVVHWLSREEYRREKPAFSSGFKNTSDFSENRQNLVGSARTEFKNYRFLEFKFGNFKKIKNLEILYKKLDQILRTLVEKIIQISTILLDKIQIESKT
jgi:hypothetical protein